jgi:hypothetical protein
MTFIALLLYLPEDGKLTCPHERHHSLCWCDQGPQACKQVSSQRAFLPHNSLDRRSLMPTHASIILRNILLLACEKGIEFGERSVKES